MSCWNLSTENRFSSTAETRAVIFLKIHSMAIHCSCFLIGPLGPYPATELLPSLVGFVGFFQAETFQVRFIMLVKS